MMASIISLALVTSSALAAPSDLFVAGASNGVYPKYNEVGPKPLQIWVDAYNKAKAAGLIPPHVPSVLDATLQPVYAAGVDTGPNGLCSWLLSSPRCVRPSDLRDAPPGKLGVSFDDGPTLASPRLYQFLEEQGIRATHFVIGSNIMAYPDIFKQSVAISGHIAGHTWAHPKLTSMTDMQLLGEFGWTGQIIFDYSGLVTTMFRPPQGDVDDRVRAIATHVFGLQCIMWDRDTSDWCFDTSGRNVCPPGQGPVNTAGLIKEMTKYYNEPTTSGHVILQHETSDVSIDAFRATLPVLLQRGWHPASIPGSISPTKPWYYNSDMSDATNATVRPALPIQSGNTVSSDAAVMPAPLTGSVSGMVTMTSVVLITASAASAVVRPTQTAADKKKAVTVAGSSAGVSKEIGAMTVMIALIGGGLSMMY